MQVMAFNRLCEPGSELWVLRRFETVVMAQTRNEVSCYHLRRVIDVVMNRVTRVETVAERRLLNDTLAAFYDLTTFHIQGDGKFREDLRAHCLNKRTCGMTR